MKKIIALFALSMSVGVFAHARTETSLASFNDQVDRCVAQASSNPACFETINLTAIDMGLASAALATCNDAAVPSEYSSCMKVAMSHICIGNLCFDNGGRHHRRHDRGHHRRHRHGRDGWDHGRDGWNTEL